MVFNQGQICGMPGNLCFALPSSTRRRLTKNLLFCMQVYLHLREKQNYLTIAKKWNLNPDQFFSNQPSNSTKYYCKYRLWFNSLLDYDTEQVLLDSDPLAMQFFVVGTSDYLATYQQKLDSI